MTPRLEIAVSHRDLLQRHGLAGPEDFMRLEGYVLNRHRHRHSLLVEFEEGRAYLKKERRVRLWDRLRNSWAGFGFVSNSLREAALLASLRQARIGCPEVLAVGETRSTAFLLLADEPETQELRRDLQEHRREADRHLLAQRLGEELGRMHRCGFTHGDLYAKHVLVDRLGPVPGFCFLDWQRGTMQAMPSWRKLARDLATLDATIGDELVSARDRLRFLVSYLRSLNETAHEGILMRRTSAFRRAPRFAREIRRQSLNLQERRPIREQRRPPVAPGTQHLLWLDGEALLVAAPYRELLGGSLADWLRPVPNPAARSNQAVQSIVKVAGGRQLMLVRRWVKHPWRWLTKIWRKPAYPSLEFEQSCLLLRLERQGVRVPRLVATGHRQVRWDQTFSFLLTEPPPGTKPLLDFLETSVPPRSLERLVLTEAGWMLRRMHDAGVGLRAEIAIDQFLAQRKGDLSHPLFNSWAVQEGLLGELRVVLTNIAGLRERKLKWQQLACKDFALLLVNLRGGLRRTSLLRFFLGYLDRPRLDAASRQLIRTLSKTKPT